MRARALLLLPLLLLGCRSGPDQDANARPNILFAVADDISFPHMSAYGTSWVSTPGFDRKNRVFKNT